MRNSASARARAPSRSSSTRPGAPELAEREAAEVGRAEVGDVEREVGLGVGPRAPRPASTRPAALVPGAERVAHLEHERPAAGVRAARQRGADVDEPHPEPVGDGGAARGRAREQEEQRMVDAEQPRRRPPASSRRRAGSARSPPSRRASPRAPRRRASFVRARGCRTRRSAGRSRTPGPAVRLEHGVASARRRVATRAGRRAAGAPTTRPCARTCPACRAGRRRRRRATARAPRRADPPGARLRRLEARPEGAVTAGSQLERQRGEPVAVAAVDRLLRGPERRERLAALVDVVELRRIIARRTRGAGASAGRRRP